MKDKKIARLVADWVFFPSIEPSGQDEAIRAFIERVAVPEAVERYSYEGLKSYIRDALKKGTNHWDFCSPDEMPNDDLAVSSFNDVE